MAQFVFRLQTVLKHRVMVEEERQRQLAQALRLRMILLDQLRRMQQGISQSKHDLAGTLVGRVDLDQVGQFARYSGQLSQRAQQIVGRLSGVERQIEAARQRLLKASADRKAMELLRDRHHQRWLAQERRAETAALDDLVVQRFARASHSQEVSS